MSNESDCWMLKHHDGVVHGPYPLQSLVDAAEAGNIANDSQVMHDKQTGGQWVVVGRVRAIALAMQSGSPVQTFQPVTPPPIVTAEPRQQRTGQSNQGRQARRKSFLSNFSRRYWPETLGKQIVGVATAAWVCGLPIAYLIGLERAYRGSRKFGSYYDFGTFMVESGFMPARVDHFVGNSVKSWTLLFAVCCVVGIVVHFVLPRQCDDSSQRN